MKQALQKSRIPDSRAFVARELIAPYFDRHWHFHQEYQLFMVEEGRGTRFIGDRMKPFREYDMVFTGPNLPHLWRNDPAYFNRENDLRTKGIVVYFGEDFLGPSWQQKEEFEEIKMVLQRSTRGLEILGETNLRLRGYLKELVDLQGLDSILMLLKILKTIAGSTDCLPITHANYINNSKESEKDRLRQVYEYVMGNFDKRIMLNDVASMVHMTDSAFSRYFTSRMNKSFSEFLSDVRIGHACKLLHEFVDMNVSEIGYECGFNTLSNFNKQFKERMGVTPKIYRKDYRRTFE